VTLPFSQSRKAVQWTVVPNTMYIILACGIVFLYNGTITEKEREKLCGVFYWAY